MDALLLELRSAGPSDHHHPMSSSSTRGGGGVEDYHGSIHDGLEDHGFHEHRSNFGGGGNYAPMKKGSYVEPGMEHLTTNIFVGNLDPMTTEEELTDAFRQFGENWIVLLLHHVGVGDGGGGETGREIPFDLASAHVSGDRMLTRA